MRKDRELHEKIMQTSLDRTVFIKAARLLGIARGDTLILENEDELGPLMDFALHEYKVNNKNTIEIYKEEAVSLNETEKEILDALLLSYTSLFKIVSISKKENLLLYKKISKKVPSDNESIKRYVSFFKLSKAHGIEVRYK